MKTELEFLIELMNQEINLDTLRTIKQQIYKIKNSDHVQSIKENNKIPTNAAFMVATKTIQVNHGHILQYLKRLDEVLKTDMPRSTENDIKLFKLLTIYRIYIHELYHSKQIYNAFDTEKEDIETEITRSLYNINRKEYLEGLKVKTREQIIEDKTLKTNNILYKHSDINPLERKAEIESFKYIRNMLLPVKSVYLNVYDELYLMELSKKIAGYDQSEVPYIKVLEILKTENRNFNIKFPYGCPNKYSFLSTAQEKLTEQQRFELGLNVKPTTIDIAYQKINRILGY